jgi:uncharacterized protein (DUF58 family)
MVEVKMISAARKWLVLLCLAAVLLAALTPGTSSIFLAFLVPLWFLFAVLISVRRLLPVDASNVRIPRDADQRSELMSITIPK